MCADDDMDFLKVKCSTCGKKYYSSGLYPDVKEYDDGTVKCRECMRKEQEGIETVIVIKSCRECPMHTWRVVPDYGDKHGCGVTDYESWYTEFVFDQCPFRNGGYKHGEVF